MQTVSTAIRQGRWEQAQAEAAASAEIMARLSRIEAAGRCVSHFDLDKDVTLKGERFFVSVFAEGGEIALTFTSYERSARVAVEIINGRTTYRHISHARRALVTTAGDVFVEIGGAVCLYARKYEEGAREILGRLEALGLWRAARATYKADTLAATEMFAAAA